MILTSELKAWKKPEKKIGWIVIKLPYGKEKCLTSASLPTVVYQLLVTATSIFLESISVISLVSAHLWGKFFYFSTIRRSKYDISFNVVWSGW